MQDLETRFKNAQSEYEAIKATCEAQVVHWRWASWMRIEPTPYYFKRHRFAKGYWLKEEPEWIGGGKHVYGFDSQNRVVVCREPLPNMQGGLLHYEEFFVYQSDIVSSTRYDYSPEKNPISVCLQRFENGKLVRFESYARYGKSTETYTYLDGRLVEIETQRNDRTSGKSYQTIETFAYDKLRRLGSIVITYTHDSRETTEYLYRRPKKGQTITFLSQTIETALLKLIPQVVANAKIHEPVYCLALSYYLGGPIIPPMIALGLESERKVFLKREWGTSALWSPAEYKHGFMLQEVMDVDLLQLCDLFNQQLDLMGISKPALETFNRVAVALMKYDWSGKLNTTADFVVYAVDTEQNHLDDNLKASVPEPILNSLREKGYL